jgi:N-acetylneuraminic acid mutarotase
MRRPLATRRGRWWLLFAALPALVATGCEPAPAPTRFTYPRIEAQPVKVSEAQGEVIGKDLFTFGGFDANKACCTPTNRAYVYHRGIGWRRLRNMPHRGITHAGMATDGRSIWYAGGYRADESWTGQIFGTRLVWRYDIATDTYAAMPKLPRVRAGGQLELLGNQLHYFGGTDKTRALDVADHWALDLDRLDLGWQRRASLHNGRHHMGSAVIGGFIYAIGGQHHHDDDLVVQNTVERYDVFGDTWTLRAPLPQAVSHIASSTFTYGNRIVVAGGEVAHLDPVADVWAYEPGANRWVAMTPLPTPKASGVAGPLGSRWLYTSGGWRGGWRATPVRD